jgi:hypothetical protein
MLGLDQRPLPGEQVRTSALGAYDQDYEGIRIGGDMSIRQDDGAPEPIRIDTLSPDLASEAGDLLAASHADYPSFRHLFPDPHRRCRVLRPFMSAAARDAALHARAMAAYDDDGGIVGVAGGEQPFRPAAPSRHSRALAPSWRGFTPATDLGTCRPWVSIRAPMAVVSEGGCSPLPLLSPTSLASSVTCTPRTRRTSRTTSASGSTLASLPSRCSRTDLTTPA